MKTMIRILHAAAILAATASMSAVAQTSMFGSTVPATTSGNQGDNQSAEVGTMFQSSLTGNITKLRYYRSTTDASQHTLKLWDPGVSTTTPVATVITSGDSGGGWKVWTLATPYAIVANHTYQVSNDAPYVGGQDHYCNTDQFLANPVVNAPLTALANGGRWAYPMGTYPTGTWANSCYFIDVVFEVPGAIPPAAPSGLSATAVAYNQINLAWTDNASDELGFKIERKTDSDGTWAEIATPAADAVSYSDTGLTGSTPYYYRVRASNAAAASASSNEADATTLATPPPPVAPTGLIATTFSDTQINLSWSDISTDETGFRIERRDALINGPYVQIATVGPNVTTYENSGLFPGTQYFYQVRATSGIVVIGDSDYSNEADATTTGVFVHGTPTYKNLLADNIYPLNATFSDTLHNAGYQYLLYTNATQNSPSTPPWWSGGATRTTTGGGNDSTRITWIPTVGGPAIANAIPVRGWGGAGETNVTFTNNLTTSAKAKMAVIVATGYGQMGGTGGYANTAVLNSITMSGFPTTFNRNLMPTQIGGWTAADVRAVVQEFELDMVAGETVTIKLTNKAFNTGGIYLAFSDLVVEAPAVPAGFAATTIGDNQIDLSWAASANATSYIIQRKTGAEGTYSQIATVSGSVTSYSDTTVRAGTQFFYQIKASGTAGESVWSSEVNATTTGTYVAPEVVWNPTLLFNDNIGNQETSLDVGLKANGYNVLLGVSGSGLASNPVHASWWSAMPTYTQVSGANLTAGVYGSIYGPLWNWTGGNPFGAVCGNASTPSVATVTFDPNITTRTTQPMAVVLTTGAGSDAGTATAQVQSIQIGDTVFPINQTLSVSGTSTAFPMGKATVGEVTMTFSPGDLIKVTLSYGSTNTWSGVSLAFKESTLPPVPAAPSGLTATAASATAINLNWLNNDTNATGYSILRLDPGQTRMQERGTVGTGVNAFNNTGLTTGSTYSYMIVARGPGGYSYSNVPTATVGNTFASWLTPPAAGFEPDSDGDGIPNGVENVLGTNPNTFSAGLIPVSSTATSVTFTHTLNPALASDVTYGYEWSSDLAEWKASGVANAGGTTATIEASTPTAGVVTVVATASGTPTATLFVRMVANNNP